nr:cytochrome b6-f complex subunit 6 [Hydrocytium acuminatum]WOR09566.1 cytochrome b6-f complex subunit 6 [Hydrocytium acuminatum]
MLTLISYLILLVGTLTFTLIVYLGLLKGVKLI